MFCWKKKSFSEKRAEVLWRRAYEKKLIARRRVCEHKYGKNQDEVLMGTLLKTKQQGG